GAKRSRDPKWRLARAEDELAHAAGEKNRFAALPEAAFLEAQVGSPEKAVSLANEALRLNGKYPDDVNAIPKANLALGLVALRSGNVAEAKSRLLAAGRTTGSGTLDTFGPNMLLAKELIEKGERDVVLDYLELCRKFWKMDRGKLTQWEGQIRSGATPEFGANLTY
ncbi:MAG TPA: hypothetical protein VG777_06380, partial [Thermoanaerobaculia bacterium]|nr:hypothetical protein [Thermoanaerobaculia bacterium]